MKKRIFAVVMAAAMVLSLAACGEKQTSNDTTPTPTTAPTATTAPTEAPADPTPTEVPAPQNVTIANASITFEDGNMGFVAPYMQHARSANMELSIVDFNGSKALKVTNLDGGKVPFLAIDASSLLGANVANVAGVEMVLGTSYEDGSFHSTSGKILSWWGADLEEASLADWSVYMAKKNPKVVSGTVAAGNELIADAGNIILVSLATDNGFTDEKLAASFYVDDIRFYDAAGNTITADTTVAFVEPEGFSGSGVDNSNQYVLTNTVEFDGYATSGGGWGQNGADFSTELLDALVPGTALEVSFESEDNSMWLVFPDATAGWSRIAQGQAYVNNSGTTAQITYEQIVAVVGEDKANWGARLQFEAQTAWEVYGVKVGTYGKNVQMTNAVEFDGYACSGGGWGQNGADFTEDLLNALVPGTALKILYASEDNTMWAVFPDATPGGVAAWTRVAQGEAACDGSVAYITYEQIVAAVGEDKTQWGARLQFEAQTNWEVFGIAVGNFIEIPLISNLVAFDGYAAKEGAWTQAGADFTPELLAALTPGSIIEISYTSEDGTMWVVLPDAAAGWSRCAQGQAICTGEKAYVTYEQIAAVVGEDQSTWGARLQFESQTAWEVYGIRVGKYPVAADAGNEGGEDTPAAVAPDPTVQVADGTVAYTGSKTFADASWWTQVDVTLADLLGGVDPATVNAIKFTCPDTNFIVGYNDTISGGWAQFDTSNTYVVKTCNFEGTDPIVCLYLSKGDSVEYTITWEVYTGGSTDVILPEVTEPETPALPETVITAADGKGSVTAADASWWTQIALTKDELLAGVALENATGIKFSSDTSFIIAYNDGAGNWVSTQDAATNAYEVAITDILFEDMEVNGEAKGYYFCFVLSKGDSVAYTINWEVLTAGGAATEEPKVEEPAAEAVTGDFSGSYVGDYSAEWIPASAFANCTDGATVTINYELQTEGRANQWWNITFIKGDWSKYLDAKYYIGTVPAFSEYEFVAMEGTSYTFTLSADALAQIKADGQFGLQTDGVIFKSYSVTPAK